MHWNTLEKLDDINKVIEDSKDTPVLLFKHSTRCSISSTALSRLERKWTDKDENIKPYYLDLINHRDVSNAVAHKFGVEHQSPQIMIIKDGMSVYDASHFDIDYQKILDAI